MAKIGNWGSYIKFKVTDDSILTFQDMKRSGSVRTSKHNLVNGKPKLEFLGPDLQTLTFRMELNAMLGVRPQKQEDKLYRYMKNGVTAPLVVGGRKILSSAMITKISSACDVIMKKGEIWSMTVDVTMSEYY